MESFCKTLEDRARQTNSLLCVGLDPHIADLSEPTPESARAFCMRLIDATADLALAFKPNAAFFEAFGPAGVSVLKEVIAAVPEGIPVILDAKRGDIASTAQAYAQAAFQALGAQAITIHPYLGWDAIQPFLSDPQHGVFMLCKTSNPIAADLQDLQVLGETGAPMQLYEAIALLANRWNTHDNLGLVAGATHPPSLRRIRQRSPDLWILAPGVGAQGGDLRAALQAGLRSDGLGMLVTVSRLLSRADNLRQAAIEIQANINQFRVADRGNGIRAHALPPLPFPLASLADGLLEAGCVQFGQFTLKSGLQSPIYIDLRRLVSAPGLLSQVAAAYLPILNGLVFDRLAALPYAAIPIATAISLQGGWPLIYPRKEAKDYGTRVEIEGVYQPGEQAVVIDDLATTGSSKFEAIAKLTAAGLQVRDVVVLIDRQSGAAEALSQAGYRMHHVFTLRQLLVAWQRGNHITQAQVDEVSLFLEREG